MTQLPLIGIIAGPDTGQEFEALRQSLEYFGFPVILRPLGRPDDLIRIISGKEPLWQTASIWLLSMHGLDGQFIVPELAKDIYYPAEPRGPISSQQLEGIVHCPGKIVLTTACTIGSADWASLFLAGGASAFIGPTEEIKGNAALHFVQTLFYALARQDQLSDAFQFAQLQDEETRLFRLFV